MPPPGLSSIGCGPWSHDVVWFTRSSFTSCRWNIQGGLGRTAGRCSTLSISILVFRTSIKRWHRRHGLESKKLSQLLTQPGTGCLLGTLARLSTGGRTNRRSNRENNEDEAGRGGRSSAPQRRGLFQRLRWPADKGRARERSPQREHAKSLRQGGSLACSLSIAPCRSRERSLDRLLHRFRRRDARREKRREVGPSPAPNCKPVSPASSGSSSPSGNGVAVPPPPQPADELDVILSLCCPSGHDIPHPDPMLQEVQVA
jgi:hypothetical protein